MPTSQPGSSLPYSVAVIGYAPPLVMPGWVGDIFRQAGIEFGVTKIEDLVDNRRYGRETMSPLRENRATSEIGFDQGMEPTLQM